MKNIKELTEQHISILAATWALEMSKPDLYYKSILRNVVNGGRQIELLPYCVVKGLSELGYDVGFLTSASIVLKKLTQSKAMDDIMNNYPELAGEISEAIKQLK